GNFSIFRSVEGAFEIIDFRADVDAAGEGLEESVGSDGIGERGKGRQAAKGEVDFGDGAVGTNIADAQGEGRIELRGIQELEEGALGVDAGNNSSGTNFFAVGENNGSDAAILDADVRDFGLRADFGAGLTRRFGEGVRQGAESAMRE